MSQVIADTNSSVTADKKYVSILAGEKPDTDNPDKVIAFPNPTFRLVVPEGTEGAVKREWEVAGKKGVKWEIPWSEMSGKITGVEFVEMEWGNLLQVTIEDEAGDLTLSIKTDTKFAQSLMQKIGNVDMEKPVSLTLYDFKKNDTQMKGVSVKQGGVAVKNSFWDEEKETYVEDYPKYDEPKFSKPKWEKYKITLEEYLVDKVSEQFKTDPIDSF